MYQLKDLRRHAMRKRGVRAGALQGVMMLIVYTHYSLDDFDDGELEDGKGDSSFRKSFDYGTLAYANSTRRSFYSDKRISGAYEDWIYYSNHKSNVSCLHAKDLVASIGCRRAWAPSHIQNGGFTSGQHSCCFFLPYSLLSLPSLNLEGLHGTFWHVNIIVFLLIQEAIKDCIIFCLGLSGFAWEDVLHYLTN